MSNLSRRLREILELLENAKIYSTEYHIGIHFGNFKHFLNLTIRATPKDY